MRLMTMLILEKFHRPVLTFSELIFLNFLSQHRVCVCVCVCVCECVCVGREVFDSLYIDASLFANVSLSHPTP